MKKMVIIAICLIMLPFRVNAVYSEQDDNYVNDQDMNISDDYSSVNNYDTSDSKNADTASNGDINDNGEEFTDGNQVSNNEVEEKTSTDDIDLTIKNPSKSHSFMVYVLSFIVICIPIVGICILLKKTVLKKR